MTTIPASTIVNVIPSVLAAGGDSLNLNMLMLDNTTRVPIGTVGQFPTQAAVASYFGAASNIAALASVYFQGYDGATKTPGNLLVAQYPATAVAAYLRGGNISGLTLSQLQAITGTLTVTMDGYARTAGALNLSAATSFSSAASIIQTAINTSLPTQASFTGVISTTTLTVSAFTGSPLAVGQTVVGAGIIAGTIITGLGTGTGGNGTYTINNSQTIGSEAMTTTATALAVSYDSTAGAMTLTSGITGLPSTSAFATGTTAAPLFLTSATGAVLSQGAAATTPAAYMTNIVNTVQNWATFMTAFNPDSSGNANKLAFAAWVSTQDQNYSYICTDTDASPTTTVPATTSLGYLITQANYSGTFLIYDPTDLNQAAFVGGVAASINFEQINGRTTFAFRSQSGIVPMVVDAQIAANLTANGYNFYGAYATANQNFQFLQPGTVSGAFKWMDSYINEIWLNNAFQLSLMELLQNSRSIPYNAAGNAMIEAALSDDINAGLNFGAFRAGVTLSSSQISAVNAAAGVTISDVLQQRGWYLQVLTPSATVRQQRGTPVCNFWYCDGESVQKISLSSVNLQ